LIHRLSLRTAAVKLEHVLCPIDPDRCDLPERTLLASRLAMVEHTIAAH